MEVEALEALCPALEQFAQDFDHCVKTRPSQRHFRRYLAGQMSGLKRKCVEPIAMMTGVAPRTLQEFLALHRWDHEAMVDCQQRRVATHHAHTNAIGLVDETSFPKKGGEDARSATAALWRYGQGGQLRSVRPPGVRCRRLPTPFSTTTSSSRRAGSKTPIGARKQAFRWIRPSARNRRSHWIKWRRPSSGA